MEQSRQLRLKRQARRLKAESALQVLEQEAHRLEAALAQEQQELPALQAQLAAVQRARWAAHAWWLGCRARTLPLRVLLSPL